MVMLLLAGIAFAAFRTPLCTGLLWWHYKPAEAMLHNPDQLDALSGETLDNFEKLFSADQRHPAGTAGSSRDVMSAAPPRRSPAPS